VQRTVGDRLLLAAAPERHHHTGDGAGRRPGREHPIPVRGRRAVVRPVQRGGRRGVRVGHGRLAVRAGPARRPGRDVRHGGRHGFR